MPRERERERERVGRKKEGRGEKAKERKLLFPCFELFPEDRLTHAVFHRSGWGRRAEGEERE